MKKMIMNIVALFTLMPIFAFASPVKNDTLLSKNDIKNMIENKSFVFTAETMTPAKGAIETLYTYFDITIQGNNAQVDLPYLGTYTCPKPTLDEAVILFTSNHFSYSIQDNEDGKWKVSIRPYDTQNQFSLDLHICESGNAQLYVNDNRRSSISFDGYLKKIN